MQIVGRKLSGLSMNSVAAFVIVAGLSFSFVLLFMLFKITAIQTDPSYSCTNEKRSSDNRYEIITHCSFNSVHVQLPSGDTQIIKRTQRSTKKTTLDLLAANIHELRSSDELSRCVPVCTLRLFTILQNPGKCFRVKIWLCRQAMRVILFYLLAVEKAF